MKHLLLSLSLLFFPVFVLAQDTPKKAPEKAPEKAQTQEDQIKQLIGELGHNDYDIREKAHTALEKIGKPALEALEKACKGKDLEVSSRAQALIEKITGQQIQPEAKRRTDVPSVPSPSPGIPETPFTPDDMKKALEKLGDFGGLPPGLKDTLDSFRKLMEGNRDGAPDLAEMGKLFEKLFNKKIPGIVPEAPKPAQPLIRGFAHDFGISTAPVDDVLRSHLIISPREGSRPAVMLGQGLVVTNVKQGSLAWKNGLRPNDIIIFIGAVTPPSVSLPGPYAAWDAWRAASKGVTQAEQLNVTKPMYIEVIRKGKPCQTLKIEPFKIAPKKDEKDF